MEEKKTIFDYVAQVLAILGSMILFMTISCLLFGEDAKEISSLFVLGKKGISVEIIVQLLGISILVVLFRILFFTDIIIKKMPIVVRMVCLLLMIIVTIVVFVVVFQWFPVNMWQPWAMFSVCFGVSFSVSLAVMILKEKMENEKMEEALKKLRQREEMKK